MLGPRPGAATERGRALGQNPPGRTYETDGDRIIARDRRFHHHYDRDEQGRQRVQVDDAPGQRTYVYEEVGRNTHHRVRRER